MLSKRLAERVGFEPTNTFWDVTHFPGERLRPLGHLSVNRILIKPTAGGIDSGHPGPRPTGALRASKIAPGDFVEPTNTFWDVTHFPGERLRPLGHLSTRPQGYRSRPGRSNLAAGRLIGGGGLVARRDVETGVFRSRRRRRKLHGGNYQGVLGIRRIEARRHFQRRHLPSALIFLWSMTIGGQF